MSDFDDYEDFVDDTATYRDSIYPVLGLSGECGEFVELVKKAYRTSGSEWPSHIDKDRVSSELGDILWYITRIAIVVGIPLSVIVDDNITKLLDRKENGKR